MEISFFYPSLLSSLVLVLNNNLALIFDFIRPGFRNKNLSKLFKNNGSENAKTFSAEKCVYKF